MNKKHNAYDSKLKHPKHLSENSLELSQMEFLFDTQNKGQKNQNRVSHIEPLNEPRIQPDTEPRIEPGGISSGAESPPVQACSQISLIQKAQFRSALGLNKYNVSSNNKNIDESDEQQMQELMILQNRELNEMWDQRAKEMSSFLIGIVIINSGKLIHDFTKFHGCQDCGRLTGNDYQYEIVIWTYTMMVFVAGIISIHSCFKKEFKYVSHGFFIVLLRSVIAFFNFERIKKSQGQFTTEMTFMFLLFAYFTQQTRESKIRNIQVRIIQILIFASLINLYFDQQVHYRWLKISFQNFVQLAEFLGMMFQLYYLVYKIFQQFQVAKNMSVKNKQICTELFQILENLEESIIILSNNVQIEYVNDKFLEQFYDRFIDQNEENVIQLNNIAAPNISNNQNGFQKFLKTIKFQTQKFYTKRFGGGNPMPSVEMKESTGINPALQKQIFSVFEPNSTKEPKQEDLLTIQQIVSMNTQPELSKMIFYYVNQDGTKKYLQIKTKQFQNQKGSVEIVQCIDISMSILYNIEKTQTQMLEMINACVSHEMRNPLNSIIAQNIQKKNLYRQQKETIQQLKMDKDISKFLVTSQDLNEQLDEGMKVQEASASILQFQLQDLLDFAQIKSGKFRMNIDQFEIVDSVEEIMMIQKRKAAENNIKLYATYENIGDGILNTDKQRLMQVLLGLLSNALKFTQEGEVEIKVKKFAEKGKNYVNIAVRDTGVGISEENQKKLFKMFGFLEETQKLNKNGIGLGLVISKNIVESFGGKIWVESEMGVGSVFQYFFELESMEIDDRELEMQISCGQLEFKYDSYRLEFLWQPNEKDHHQIDYVRSLHEKQLDVNQPERMNSELSQMSVDILNQLSMPTRKFCDGRVLIVDDQGFNIDATKIILQYTVGLDSKKYCESATSGNQALKMVKEDVEKNGQSKYNLILMDLNMPEMNGVETMVSIREFFYSHNLPQPIISAVTGHSAQIYVDDAINAGMNQVLSKPVQSRHLTHLIKKLRYPCKKIR